MTDDRPQGILEALPQGVYEIDHRGIITYTNAAHDALLGRPAGWSLGRSIGEIITCDETRRACLASLPALFRGAPGPHPTVLPMRHADGHILQVQVNWNYRRDAEGRVVGLAGILSDVTRSLRAEAGMAAAQRMARLGSWSLDPRAGRLTWSAETSEIFGLPLDHRAGTPQSLLAAVHPADRRAKLQALKHLQADGTPYRLTYRLAAASGRPRTVEERAEALRDEHGGIVLLRGVVHDVTELHAALDAARDTAARLDQALRLGHMGAWDWDTESGAMWWSDEARRLLGVADDEPAQADAFLAMVHPEDRPTVRLLVDSLTPHGGPATYEFRLRRPDGEERMLRSEVECLYGADGRRIVRGIHRDVTLTRRQERALNIAVRQAREAAEASAGLVVGLAADLRPSLSAIAGHAEVMADALIGPLDSAPYRAYAANIRTSSQRLRDMVQDVLDLIETVADGGAPGRGRAEGTEGVDAAALIAEAYHVLCRRLPDCARRLLVDPPGDLPWVRGDARRLTCILVILMERVVVRSGSRGRVRLTVRPVGDDLEVSLSEAAAGADAKGWERPAQTCGAGALVDHLIAVQGGRISVAREADSIVTRLFLPAGPAASVPMAWAGQVVPFPAVPAGAG